MSSQSDPTAAAALRDVIFSCIRERGGLTVAGFMELALYHPSGGYYATASRRSGREGDFYTSVDVGPLFGELLAVQIAEMADRIEPRGGAPIDLVEAGAGDGRLARDVLDAIASEQPELYARLRIHLVEASAAARAAQKSVLGSHAARLCGTTADLPHAVTGIIVANELLDALPAHIVQMTDEGLREVWIEEHEGSFRESLRPLSTLRLSEHLAADGASLAVGARAAIGLAAADWVREAANRLDRGFLLLLDYGHEARALYSEARAAGTLAGYRRHTVDAASWLDDPGHADITAHVDLTAIRRAASEAGCEPLGLVDQTYFLSNLGLIERLQPDRDPAAIARRIAAKTLILPGGLGSTIKVMAFGKQMGRPMLRGFVSGRLT